jgi:hypothetical protein
LARVRERRPMPVAGALGGGRALLWVGSGALLTGERGGFLLRIDDRNRGRRRRVDGLHRLDRPARWPRMAQALLARWRCEIPAGVPAGEGRHGSARGLVVE